MITSTAPTIPRTMLKTGRFNSRADPDADAGRAEEVDEVDPAGEACGSRAVVEPDAEGISNTEDTCVIMVVPPEIISVETRVVLEGAEPEGTTVSEDAAVLVGSEPVAEEALGAGDVGSEVGDGVDTGSALAEVGEVVDCVSLGVGVDVGLGEGVAVVDEVAGVVVAAPVTRVAAR